MRRGCWGEGGEICLAKMSSHVYSENSKINFRMSSATNVLSA